MPISDKYEFYKDFNVIFQLFQARVRVTSVILNIYTILDIFCYIIYFVLFTVPVSIYTIYLFLDVMIFLVFAEFQALF